MKDDNKACVQNLRTIFLWFFILILLISNTSAISEKSKESESKTLERREILVKIAEKNCRIYDLESVYQIALENDAKIRAARAALLAAQEANPQARALFFPVLNATTSNTSYHKRYFGNKISVSNFTLPLTNKLFHWNQGIYALNLSQPIFYYQNWVQLDKADAEVKQANAIYASAEQDLIMRTIQAYFNVLKAVDQLKYADSQLKSITRLHEQTQARFKAGIKNNTITDVQVAKARRDSAETQVIAAKNNVEIQKKILMQITCIPIEQFAYLQENIVMRMPEPNSEEQWICTALRQNLDLEASRFSLENSRADIRLNASGHFPTINVNGALIKSDASRDIVQLPKNRDAQISINANFPIFNGGSVISKTRQARFLYDQALNQTEALYRQVESDTSQSYLNVITQISQIKALKQSKLSSKTSLESIQQAVEAGIQYTVADILNAISDLTKSEQDYVNARYDYIIQSVILKKNAGLLCPEDIILINQLLSEQC